MNELQFNCVQVKREQKYSGLLDKVLIISIAKFILTRRVYQKILIIQKLKNISKYQK